ncbi:hypothetical protein [uncultured Methylobacterium sp.]|uniref:hypothetical protein n=1 Tax=uncultured Methylobacterium sp. TaxID=157278 RepID=UPI002593F747|nr:hypothetical protein [uncultured Methylobacterium sp.]
MSKLDWEIHPKIGAGPINFSMDKSTISSIIGAPIDQNEIYGGDIREYRQLDDSKCDLILQYTKENLSAIVLPCLENDIKIFGKKIYKSPASDIVRDIMEKNGGCYTDYGDYDLCFNSLNLILHDFMSSDRSDKGVSIWSKAAYARLISNLELDGPGRDIYEL